MMGPESVQPVSQCCSRGIAALSYVMEFNLEGNFLYKKCHQLSASSALHRSLWVPWIHDHKLTDFYEKI